MSCNNSYRIIQTTVTEAAYKQDFVIADWVVGAGSSTISIPQATHSRLVNPTVSVYENDVLVMIDELTVDSAGDVTLSVLNGFEFDGKVIITA